MSKKFEDEFMDLQSELISLCLEVTNKRVDKIYAYASIEEKSQMFNAFFEVAGEIKMLNQLGINNTLAMQFLKLGTGDLGKIKALCKEYDMATPTELKMYYDVKSGKYNADYQYIEVCSSKTGISAGEVFMNWVNQQRQELGKD